MTKFKTSSDGYTASATLKSMFKFPEGYFVDLCLIIALNNKFQF